MIMIKCNKMTMRHIISYSITKWEDHGNNRDGTMQYHEWWTWSKKQNMTMALIMIVTAPKLGYQFLCCYSFLASILKIFLLSLQDDSEKSCHFQPFETLLMSLSVGKTSFASSQTHSNPNSKFLEFECGLCDYKGFIIFLDLLIIPSVPRDPSTFLNPGYAKILLSPLQYFWDIVYSFSCIFEE